MFCQSIQVTVQRINRDSSRL